MARPEENLKPVRPVSGWGRMWWCPLFERRRIGWFLSTAPTVPVDVNSFWWEYRLAIRNRKGA